MLVAPRPPSVLHLRGRRNALASQAVPLLVHAFHTRDLRFPYHHPTPRAKSPIVLFLLSSYDNSGDYFTPCFVHGISRDFFIHTQYCQMITTLTPAPFSDVNAFVILGRALPAFPTVLLIFRIIKRIVAGTHRYLSMRVGQSMVATRCFPRRRQS